MKLSCVFVVVGILVVAAPSVARAQQSCDLDCPIDAPCTINQATGMPHCACPPGWTGQLCNVLYESCGLFGSCLHGGTCVLSSFEKDAFDNRQLVCDCSTAKTSNGISFVGKYCETPATDATEQCDDGHFCLAGGTCWKGSVGCDCPGHRTGHFCEFDAREVPDCVLDCGPHGTCQVGIKKNNPKGLDDGIVVDSTSMWCHCDEGFVGDTCSTRGTICGGDDDDDDASSIVCYHGSTCAKTTDSFGNDRYHCDCTSIDKSLGLFAGKHCQFPATEICSENDPNLFCVNNGSCRPDNPLAGCDCGSSDYTGFKCELPVIPPHKEEPYTPTHGIPCGDDGLMCYHHGTCIMQPKEGTDSDSDLVVYSCDCANAFDDEHLYSGDSCELRSTAICAQPSRDSLSGAHFCVRNGECDPNHPLKACDCPDWFGGLHCELQVPSSDQDESAQACGHEDLVCHNGGTCKRMSVRTESGGTRPHYTCDCSTAFDDEGNYFAGNACEHKATSYCTVPSDDNDDQAPLFCTNHGTCNPIDPRRGCACDIGFTGPACEFSSMDNLVDRNEDEHKHHKTVPCGDDSFCYHGGTCQADGTCDCSTAISSTALFAGDSCEFRSTDICNIKPYEEELDSSMSFCVNHGVCGTNGCRCPVGWTGKHCHIHDPEANPDPTTPDAIPCGPLTCLHGGTCQEQKLTGKEGEPTESFFLCDCLPTITETEAYAGHVCQHKSTSICATSENGDVHFCTNFGTCSEDTPGICDCPPGWTGNSCEFRETAEDVQDALLDPIKDDPDVQPCKNGQACLNGGVCDILYRKGADIDDHCDCSLAFDDEHRYAGEFCQYKSTSICSDGDGDGDGASFCVNGGTCTDYGCDCPSGWTGSFCEYPVTELDKEEVDPEFVRCGDKSCFNGGWCFEDVEVGDETCGCGTFGEDAFAGDQCQFVATEYCNDGDFCVNNGRCHEGGCRCPTGYTGDRCDIVLYATQEQPLGEDDGDWEDDGTLNDCTLACKNGGMCVEGAKDLGDFSDVLSETEHLDETYDATHFEHCICPRGWVGLTCDEEVVLCGQGEHLCLHGSTCVSNDDDSSHGCDCDAADALVAGKHCQHKATDICTQGGEPAPGHPIYFCVNYGTCRGYVSASDLEAVHPGCDCDETRWTGTHCEIPVEEGPHRHHSNKMPGLAIFYYMLVAISIVVLLGGFVFYLVTKHKSSGTGGLNPEDVDLSPPPSPLRPAHRSFRRPRRRISRPYQPYHAEEEEHEPNLAPARHGGEKQEPSPQSVILANHMDDIQPVPFGVAVALEDDENAMAEIYMDESAAHDIGDDEIVQTDRPYVPRIRIGGTTRADEVCDDMHQIEFM